MTENESTAIARFVGLAYTRDVDPSVAGYSPLPGFGSFFIPCSGSLTAVVGRNGSGKSRFLASVGHATELVYDMPEMTEKAPLAVELEGRATTVSLPTEGLWQLAPDIAQVDSHEWVAQDVSGRNEWVSYLWQEAPRRRFEYFLDLLSAGDLPQAVSGFRGDVDAGNLGAGPRSAPLSNDRYFSEELVHQLLDLTEEERHLVACAATAMHLWEYRAGSSITDDLFALGLGKEIADSRRISLSGSATNSSQRMRFWFPASWSSSPACAALLAAHAKNSRSSGCRKDLLDLDPSFLGSVIDVAENFESVVYAWGDAGLEETLGTPMHFTPLLPLSIDGTAGVIQEDSGQIVWLDGLRARLAGEMQAAALAGVLHPLGKEEWGASSWRFARPDRDWPSEPNEGAPDDESKSYEQFLRDELQDDQSSVGWISERWTTARAREEALWRSSLVHSTSEVRPLDFTFGAETAEFVARAVRAVNFVAGLLSERPPAALFDLSSGEGRWRFQKSGSPPKSARDVLDLQQLSFAEQRWMRFSILVASRLLDRVMRAFGSDEDAAWSESVLDSTAWAGPVRHADLVFVLDEPEQGLHPTAIDRLTRGLNELSVRLGVHFVVATHSPNVLRVVQTVKGTIAHAHVDESGATVVEALNSAEWDALSGEVGMSPVDLLQMTSTFLLVEGEHDRIVLGNLIGPDIRRAGVVTTPLRGALKVSQIVDSDIVWRFTDARLVLVLDSLDADQMSGIVSEAKRLLAKGDGRGAVDVLEPLKRDRTSKGRTEREALYELLRAAVTANRIDRLEIFGLSEPDIIDYFHPRELGPVSPDSEYFSLGRREAWDVLHARYMNTPKKERKDAGFKSWAVDVLGVGTDPSEVLRNASASLDRIPDDFIRLRDLLCSVKPSLE